MKKGLYTLCIVFVCSVCVLLGIFIGRNHREDYEMLHAKTETASTKSYQSSEAYLLDINSATVLQLLDLPGIGDTIAQRIVDYREKNGPFQTIEELMYIDGIGEKKLQEIKSLIRVGG